MTLREIFADDEWRAVTRWGVTRQVSSRGQVRGAYGKILACTPNTNGYPRVEMGGHDVFVHDLVAEAFIGQRPNGWEVDHIDGDRSNSAVGNLQYVTRAENMKRAADRRRARRPPCANCGAALRKAPRKGRCPACAEYLRRTGSERPAKLAANPHHTKRRKNSTGNATRTRAGEALS